jgi:hypothetical protein
MTLTTAQMDSIIARMAAKYPADFGDAPTWEVGEQRREIEEHGTAPLDTLALSRAEVQRHRDNLASVDVNTITLHSFDIAEMEARCDEQRIDRDTNAGMCN